MDISEAELGDLELEHGGVLTDARIVYGTAGRLNSDRSNAVLLPSYYAGTHTSYLPLIGADRALDPERWFVVAPNMFGNGQSSSPSNRRGSGTFPPISIGDNVAAQYRLVSEHLALPSLALVAGWSMGGMQALHWGARHPPFVKRIFAWCGSARCWPLNHVFLDSVRAALLADPEAGRPTGLRAFGRGYAGWAYSAQFYRDALWRSLGFATVEGFLESWEEDHLAWDWRDLLVMLSTWQGAIEGSADADGRLDALLADITARTILMPCDQDMYFTMDESALESRRIKGSELRVLRSPYGHCAGAPGRFAEETRQISAAIQDILGL